MVSNSISVSTILEASYKGKKFEYLVDYDLSSDKLNELGARGWELVSTVAFICDGENTIKFFLKREKA